MKKRRLSLLLIVAFGFFMLASTANATDVKKPLPDFSKIKIEKREAGPAPSASASGEVKAYVEKKLKDPDPAQEGFQEMTKIRPDLQKCLVDLKPNETIRINVWLDYYSDLINVDDFVSKIMPREESVLGNLKIEKLTAFDFLTDATKEQIEFLSKLEEVERLTLPDIIQQIDDFHQIIDAPSPKTSGLFSSGVTPMLNAATEMTGAKKARQDYGVTGDRDGNETSYSKNDVVIAIIDTGIDNTHVDLDGGKVTGWRDFVNQKQNPYDDHGHGTMVASIAAGTGEGDPSIEVGFAPGAALVGIKVADSTGHFTIENLVSGINWAVAYRSVYGIKIINISLGAYGNSSDKIAAVNTAITNAANAGIAVVVGAGNNGPKYGTMSQVASCDNAIAVGNMADPYEGGWYPSLRSSRGAGATGPFIMAPGRNIRAAKANSTSGYVTDSGTSFAAPAVAGIIALMTDANNGQLTLGFGVENFGKPGFDPVYGNGEILAYDSIKIAGGYSSGSFDDYRDHLWASDTIQQGHLHLYGIDVYATSPNLYWATTLLMTDEDNDDFDLHIWKPGRNPSVDAPDYSSISADPQEVLSFIPTIAGVYTVGIHAYSGNGNYVIDFSGQIDS